MGQRTMSRRRNHPVPENARLRLSVLGDLSCGRYVRERVTGFASSFGVSDRDLAEFVAAVSEALANAVEHSHAASIEVSCWIVDHELFATVTDDGAGFPDPARGAAPLPDAFAERGRGLALMERFTDFFKVDSAPGRGTRVTLSRRIDRADGEGAGTAAM